MTLTKIHKATTVTATTVLSFKGGRLGIKAPTDAPIRTLKRRKAGMFACASAGDAAQEYCPELSSAGLAREFKYHPIYLVP